MRIEVLGGLRVVDEDDEITIGGRLPRLTLAALASQAGRALSVDRLIDHVWAERPPKTARNSLQIAVHRLRRALGEGAIEHRDNGYVLRVDDDQVDALRFERLAAEGSQLHSAGDFESAAAHFVEALGLWSGLPYAGFDEELLVREASRLTELRLVTLDRAYDVALRLGRHAEVAAQLPDHVAAQPLHEGLRAHLMLALYRCGRQAEALEVFRDGRELLVEELGLEPGPQLRQLESAILQASPELEWMPPTMLPARPAPAELPAANPGFTGRDAELAMLADLFAGAGPRLICISGAGGVGKSALAVQAAQHVAKDFPDGQLYVDLLGATPALSPLEPIAVLNRFVRALGEQPAASADEAAATYRTLTAARRVLVVLDNAASAAQVRPLLPGGDRCAVVVTSRTPITTLDGARQLRLDELPAAESMELLVRMAEPGRLDIEPAAAAEVIELCGRWPLALRIVGARLAADPDLRVEELAERLRNDQQRLDVLEYGDLAVRTSVEMSVAALAGDDARTLFLDLSTLGLPDLPFPAAAAVLGDAPRARRALEQLAAQQLVVRHGNRFAQHDLVRLLGRELAGEEAATRAATRVGHYYLASARAALAQVYTRPETYLGRGLPAAEHVVAGETFADSGEAMTWIAAEHVNHARVVELVLESAEQGPEVAVALVNALDRPLTRGAWFEDLVRSSELGVEAARRTADPAWMAAAHANAALALQRAGFPQDPRVMDHLAAALDSAAESGDLESVARCRNVRGVALLGQDDAQGARDELEAARAVLAERWSDAPTPLRWAILLNRGIATAQLGDYAGALADFEAAQPMADDLGDLAVQATLTYSLGKTRLRLGEYAAADAHLTEAIGLSQKTGDRLAEATGLWTLGELCRETGDTDRAQEVRRRSLGLLNETGAVTDQEMAAVLADPNADPPRALASI